MNLLIGTRELGWWEREMSGMVNMQVSDRGLGREGRCKVAAKVVMKRLPCTWGGCPGHQGIVHLCYFYPSYTQGCTHMLSHFSGCPVFVILWTASWLLLSMGFSRILEWVYMPTPPVDLSCPGIKPTSLAFQVWFFTTEPLGTPYFYLNLESSSFTLLSCLWTELYSFLEFLFFFLF